MKRRTFLKGVGVAAASTVMPTSFSIAQRSDAQTLRFMPQGGLTVLDPVFSSAGVTKNHGWAVYDTLFGMNNKQEPMPQMAEGYTSSDDGRTYLIKLREGLKFHNGEPVRAQDCAPSLKRWAVRDAVGQTVSEFVDEWGVQDDRTIKITLKEPLALFMELIGKGGATVAVIMPEHLANTDPFKPVTDPTGSGPLKFVQSEFVTGSLAVYEKFADYVPRQEPAEWASGGKVMHFDRVEMQFIPDSATASAALQAGEIDWYEEVQSDLVPLLRSQPNIAIGNVNPTAFNGVLRFNHLYPPFDNVEVRRAVMMAVNQQDYITAVTGGDIEGSNLCKAMLPCGTTYGRELGESFMPGNIEKAKAALSASGYKGEKVVVLNPTDFPSISPFDYITYDILQKIGMNVELATSDWAVISQRRSSKKPPEEGGWSILHTRSASSTIANPVEQLYIRGLGEKGWNGWYADDKIEKLTREWLTSKTLAERQPLADAIQLRAFEMVPYVPLGQFQLRTAYSKRLEGKLEGYGAYMWNVRRV